MWETNYSKKYSNFIQTPKEVLKQAKREEAKDFNKGTLSMQPLTLMHKLCLTATKVEMKLKNRNIKIIFIPLNHRPLIIIRVLRRRFPGIISKKSLFFFFYRIILLLLPPEYVSKSSTGKNLFTF